MGAGDWRSCPGAGPARTAVAGLRTRARVVRTWHMRGAPARVLTWAATPAHWACGAMSRRARSGSTQAAASVPVMVWYSRAEMICPVQVACRLHLYLLSLASICARPSFHTMVGVGQVRRASRTVS